MLAYILQTSVNLPLNAGRVSSFSKSHTPLDLPPSCRYSLLATSKLEQLHCNQEKKCLLKYLENVYH